VSIFWERTLSFFGATWKNATSLQTWYHHSLEAKKINSQMHDHLKLNNVQIILKIFMHTVPFKTQHDSIW
jgi:hypothetical protein